MRTHLGAVMQVAAPRSIQKICFERRIGVYHLAASHPEYRVFSWRRVGVVGVGRVVVGVVCCVSIGGVAFGVSGSGMGGGVSGDVGGCVGGSVEACGVGNVNGVFGKVGVGGG